jgi:GT2 family glycosyltransferase
LACGEHLVFLDDDCRVSPDWFVQLESAIRKHPEAIIGGRILNGLPANPFAANSQAIIDYICACQGNLSRDHSFFTTNNLIVPASKFNRIGGFNPHYPFAGEDREMCYRWCRAGGRLVFVPDLSVFHFHHMNFAAFWRQHYRYGRGTLRYHLNRARYESRRHIKLEPFKFYLGLLTFNTTHRKPAERNTRLVLTLTSQLATAVGFTSLIIQRFVGRSISGT